MLAPSASANETDNFYLPLDPEFADLGEYLAAVHTRAIEQGVRAVNGRIDRALRESDPAVRALLLDGCHSRDTLVRAVDARFGDPLTERQRIESALSAGWARASFPGRTLMHGDIAMNLRTRKPYDPRALLLLAQSRTIKACGVYFGTDKLLHFHQVGHRYYRRYRAKLRERLSPKDARQEMVEYFGTKSFLAEGNAFGLGTTGIYSNADMAANYMGFLFFLNLTESVVLLDRKSKPLVVRCGTYWRVNDHVRPLSGWFRAFVSDHWNEALNPSLYEAAKRPAIRQVLESRADHIVRFYTENDGRPKDARYFEQLARTLSTLAGEPYGHSGQLDQLLHIGNVCIPALAMPTPRGNVGSRAGAARPQ